MNNRYKLRVCEKCGKIVGVKSLFDEYYFWKAHTTTSEKPYLLVHVDGFCDGHEGKEVSLYGRRVQSKTNRGFDRWQK